MKPREVQRSVASLARHGAGTLLFGLGLPFWAAHRKTRGDLGSRLGLIDPVEPGGLNVWYHGASAGDVAALLPLMAALQALRPHRARLTAFTETGLALARREAPEGTYVSAAPFDAPAFVDRFVRRAQPHLLVLERAELWPSLILGAKRSGARVAVVNGWLRPERVVRHAALLRALGDIPRGVDVVLARSTKSAERFARLGVPRGRISVSRDTKLDRLSVKGPFSTGAARGGAMGPGFIWMAASAHADEEMGFLHAHRALRARAPSSRLVLVPRYPARAGVILLAARRLGLFAELRSHEGGHPDVVVVDTFGELLSMLDHVDVSVVGGSFGRRGGQNPYEAAARGRPQIFGPRMASYEGAAVALEQRGAAERVLSFDQLPERLERFDEDVERRHRMGRAAADWVLESQGGAAQAAEVLVRLLGG